MNLNVELEVFLLACVHDNNNKKKTLDFNCEGVNSYLRIFKFKQKQHLVTAM